MTVPHPSASLTVARHPSPVAVFLAKAGIAALGIALAACFWLVPGVPGQPRGLRGVIFAISGRRHAVYHGLAIDAPDGYLIHTRFLSDGQPSLVLTATKPPWEWPDLNGSGFGMLFVQPDPALRLRTDSAECATAHDRPCHVERMANGDVTCFVHDSPPKNGLDARRSFDCLNARTALEVKLFSPVATVQPIRQALLGPLSN